jgi:hypothetical protein
MNTKFCLLVCAALPLAIQLFAAGGGPRYASAKIDANGRLYLVTSTGIEVHAPKLKGQTHFEQVEIAEEGRTVGWLADYPNPTVTNYKGAMLAGNLVVFRNGRILHVFDTEQVFWGWAFRGAGSQVAYCTGPTHGGTAECLLRRVDSGAVMERWVVKGDGTPPAWVHDLRY